VIKKEKKVATNNIKPSAREQLLKGKAQYNRPPCTNPFRSAAFDNEKDHLLYYI